MKSKLIVLSIVGALSISTAYAQALPEAYTNFKNATTVVDPNLPSRQIVTCNDNAVTCSPNQQYMGDTTTSADDVNSNSTHLGNSSADTNGGTVNNGGNKVQQTGNTVDQSGNSIKGGDGGSSSSWGNTGGNSKNDIGIGNTNGSSSSNGNNSGSANTTNSGGNVTGGTAGAVTGGNSSSNAGNSSTNSGDIGFGNVGSGNGSNNTMQGGQGGAGGKVDSNNTNLGITGGNTLDNSHSGNSANKNSLGQGQDQGQSLDNKVANQNGQSSDNKNVNSQGQSSTNTNGQSSDNRNVNGQSSENRLGQSADNHNSTKTSNDGSGNSAIGIDLSDHSSVSYQEKTIFIPAVVPFTTPSTVGVGNVVASATTCGPLQKVVNIPVTGYFFGMTGKKKVDLGYTQETVPYVNERNEPVLYKTFQMPDGSLRYIGHSKLVHVVPLGVAGSRNLALGGGNSEGSWGQAGGGASSSMQRLVKYIELTECEMPVQERTRIVEVERKRVRD